MFYLFKLVLNFAIHFVGIQMLLLSVFLAVAAADVVENLVSEHRLHNSEIVETDWESVGTRSIGTALVAGSGAVQLLEAAAPCFPAAVHCHHV